MCSSCDYCPSVSMFCLRKNSSQRSKFTPQLNWGYVRVFSPGFSNLHLNPLPRLYIMSAVRLKSKVVLRCWSPPESEMLYALWIPALIPWLVLRFSLNLLCPRLSFITSEKEHVQTGGSGEEEQAQLWSLRLISVRAKQNLCCWSYLSFHNYGKFSQNYWVAWLYAVCLCVRERDYGRTPAWLVKSQSNVLYTEGGEKQKRGMQQ